MRNKPLYLTLFPLLSALIALSFPIQIYFIYKIPINDYERIFSMLTPLNLVSMSSLFIASVLTLFLNKWIYKVIPILLFVLFGNNAIVGLYGTDYTLVQVCLSFVLFSISLKPFYKKEIKAVILNPRLRWWKTPTRYQLNKPIQLHSEKFELHSETINLSTSGIFAKVLQKDLLDSIDLNDVINLKIGDDNTPINLKAKVVRINSSLEHQPDGFGLEILKDEVHKKEYLPWLSQNVNAISA